MKLILITDRHLMGGETGFAAAIAAAVRGLPPQSAIVQVREKDLGGAALLALVHAAQMAASEQRVVVNDRLDVALAADAFGVHLPEDGLELASVRGAAPMMFVGCSRHTPAAAIAAADAGVDLVQLGPVWATPSKERYGAALGTEPLTAARAGMNPRCLLVAVGGIDGPARAAAAREAGADVVAVVRAVWTARDPAAAARAMM